MKALHDRIDRMAEQAQIEIMKDGLRARCQLNGLVAHHNRSLAQLRRNRMAERLAKQQGDKK
jgi:hypothetical protein